MGNCIFPDLFKMILTRVQYAVLELCFSNSSGLQSFLIITGLKFQADSFTSRPTVHKLTITAPGIINPIYKGVKFILGCVDYQSLQLEYLWQSV